MRIVNWIKNLTIIGFSLLALVAVVANFNLPVKGFRLLVVQSGSMEPAIGVGSIVLTKPTSDFLSPISASKFNQGEIITFSSGNSLVSHRVIDSKYENGEFLYQTKGDANQQPDNTLVSEKKTVGKVIFTAPTLGKFVQFLKTPLGYFLMILIPSLYVIVTELFVLWRELRKTNETLSFSLPSKALTPVIVLIFGAFYFVGGTASYFTDTAASTNNVFATAQSFEQFADHIVISEVQTTGGSGGGATNLTDRDFIELYNPTNSPINLNGYRLVKRTGSGVPNDTNIISFTSSHVIPAHGYFLWASSESPGWASTIGADVTSSQTLAIPNNSIALRFGALDTGTIIDALSWASTSGSLVEGTKFTPDLDPNQSMERKSFSTSTATTMTTTDALKGNGFDSNNNATDFVLRSVSQPQNSSSPTESP